MTASRFMRAGLEDHFCGKLLGLPMGCDICYTNHAEADQDDMDALLTMLGVAGCNYIMGVPGADDVMLHYQSTSFHDALYLRSVLGLKPAPEFEAWLERHPPTLSCAMAIDLRSFTPARVALGRTGHSVPTAELLRFQLDHARARDAVYRNSIRRRWACRTSCAAQRRARSRHLSAPPRSGATLSHDSRVELAAGDYDAAIVIADGLSATAVHHHAVPLVGGADCRVLAAKGWRLAPLTVVLQGRVAVGDEIGERLGAGMVVVLIGERPGLTSPDSLGVYLTWDPRPGRTDAERNCISNVRAEGIGL